MRPEVLSFAACAAAITLVGALAYRQVWIKLRGSLTTPTGFGVFLAVVLWAASVAFGASVNVTLTFFILTIATAIYWLDDLFGLSARLRLGLSFITGVSICALLLSGQEAAPLGIMLCFYLAAGILNVVLTNIVNFYDGADLNLATFIALISGAILLFTPAGDVMASSAIACLAFIVPFAVMNSRPKTIYLGDAGSFAFASFLTMTAIDYFSRGRPSAEFAIPLALPALDTFYVFCIRVIERHDLMTRNYLHLYQKLNQRYRGFGYLLPQVINAGLSLICALALQAWGLTQFASVAIASVLVTVPFYFSCRGLFLRKSASCGGAT